MVGFTYKSYNFVNKDPMIDFIRTVVSESGLTYNKICENSGVNHNTLRAWLYGTTKKPQAATMNAVLRACNYKLNISPIDAPMLIVPTAYEPVATEPKPRKRLGAAKYANVHHISAHRKRK
jgi:transcriptional regulator with XRE-family HTH domain